MLRYSSLNIKRVIFHRILSRTETREHVTTEFSKNIVELSRDLTDLLKERLVDSCGRDGKSFELSIENDCDDSTFSNIKDINKMDNEQFINVSKELVTNLADIQDKKPRIPGGYFLLVEAENPENLNKSVYIILKAENENALAQSGDSIQVLNNIFLSPAQKMYKAGVFEQISENEILSKTDFKAYLFDSQFNEGTKLAEYFYKDFLGLTIDGNSKVQTKMFYDQMMDIIDSVFKGDFESRNKYKAQIQAEMANQSTNIDAREIINRIIPSENRDRFMGKIGRNFSRPFSKNCDLIRNKVEKSVLYITDNIRLYGPSENLTGISIMDDPENPNVKIIRLVKEA